MKDTINKLVSNAIKNDHEEYLVMLNVLLDKLKLIKSEKTFKNAFHFRLDMGILSFNRKKGLTVFDELNSMCRLLQLEELEKLMTERANNMLIEKEAEPAMVCLLDEKLLERCILLTEVAILRVKLECIV